MCLWSYSDQHLGFFNFNFKMIFFLASIALNIKMFFQTINQIFFFSENAVTIFLVKILLILLFHHLSVFTLRVYALLPVFLDQIGLGKHSKRTMLPREDHFNTELTVRFQLLFSGGTL